jgi:nicotinamide-nucleotide amidase
MTTFPEPLLALAQSVINIARQKKWRITTAESCTGGLIAGCLTAIPGSSDVFERGFVTYSDESKTDLLGVPADLIAEQGAVSKAVAAAMAMGAANRSAADFAVSCTGIAGPGGRTATKPVGTVYLATAGKDGLRSVLLLECGDIGRDQVRKQSVEVALKMLQSLLQSMP